ncbi:hypothetical protein [Sphingomonas montanisoli]|uniref:Uncharacterized protein n=1 Tax=Sphingomonas montanisoli TaxID=2606412 RepID=A0A5D9C4D4_9SPHN|nr:hypothetical protein [Sphingomonas montanisoli]TZG26356.1 hypothetical protein FYJ91_15605 [Sphingomonas montanisoli]
MKTRIALMSLAVALAGCGQREALKPKVGQSLPQKPATAAVQPTVPQLLTPGIDTRPRRTDDLLTRSEERPDDRFDLPPPG